MTDAKTVLVTGASRGLGRCLAVEYAHAGYDVLITGRDADALTETAKQVTEHVHCGVIVGDITSTKTIDDIANRIADGNIEGLVNNAGVYLSKPAQDIAPEELRKVMDVNFFAPAELIRRAIPSFIRRKSGFIVNMNSVAGKAGSRGESAYCASKHALRGYTESLRQEVTAKGVRIIDVYLGGSQTGMTAGRKEYDLLINPVEAARVIVRACADEPSVAPNELHLGRRNYPQT